MKKVALTLCLLFLITTAYADESNVLTPERIADIESVMEVSLDPEGKKAAYILDVPRSPSDDPGGSYRHLWLADIETGASKRLTGGKERLRSIAWTPDGKRIAFLAKRSGDEHTQIYTLRTRGGEAKALTDHDASIGAFRYSPDGKMIAMTSRDPKSEAREKAEKAGRDEIVYDSLPRYQRIYVRDAKKKGGRVLTGDMDVLAFVWTPDNSSIIFQAAPTPQIDDGYMNRRLHIVNVESGKVRKLAQTPGKLGPMEVSPDGVHLAFLSAVSRNDPLAQSVFLVSLENDRALIRNLTEDYEASAVDLRFRDDGSLLLLANEGEYDVIDTLDISTGERQRQTRLPFIANFTDLAGDVMVAAGNTPEHPGDLFVTDANGRNERRLTRHADLGDTRLARQEVIEWEGADGWTIRGILTYPLDYEEGKRYPLVLQIHGGPEGVSLNGWRTNAIYPVQLLARDGFMVLEPNYRGSGGRGVAFSKADHGDLGGKEFDDVLAGIDALVERGLVDGDRVGSGGFSYGGYFSAWAATRHTKRFKAAVMGAGIANWVSFTGTTDIPYEMSLVHWNNWWFDHPELHWERSPIAHARDAYTPTLILHGAEDLRVPLGQSQELYTALKVRGVPTELVVYPREEHGFSERGHRLDAMERVLKWFGEYLGVPEVAPVDEPLD